jgi:hypothetical protein
MRVTWDEGFEEKPAPQAVERADVPEGVHEFQIKQVIQHADKLELRLVHDDRRYGWVFCRIPDGDAWGKILTKELVSALGMTPAEWAAGESTDIVGRRVAAEIVHRQGRDRLWVNVSKFLAPAPVEEKPEPKPRATKAQKIAAASTEAPSDDIPF